MLGDRRFEFRLAFLELCSRIRTAIIEVLGSQREQLGGRAAFLFLVAPVAFGGLRLAVEVLDLLLNLVEHIQQAIEILFRVLDAVRGLATALLVLGDTRGLLDEDTHLLGLGLDQARNHALLDNRVAARPEARAEKYARDVFTAALGAIQEVAGDAISGHFAANRDLGVFGVLAFERRLAVVEQQLDRCGADGLARA